MHDLHLVLFSVVAILSYITIHRIDCFVLQVGAGRCKITLPV